MRVDDFCSLEGAEILRAMIEDYWRAKGFAVYVRPTPAGYVQEMRSTRFDLRSDMRNGMPVQREEKPAHTT